MTSRFIVAAAALALLGGCAQTAGQNGLIALAVDAPNGPGAARLAGATSSPASGPADPAPLLEASTRDSTQAAARSNVVSYYNYQFASDGRFKRASVDSDTFGLIARGASTPAVFAPATGEAMVFVHGFNNTDADAINTIRSLRAAIGFHSPAIAFTWPSHGGETGFLRYLYDLQSSTFSRDALTALLARLGADPAIGRIHVFAHSMGGWLAMESLRQAALTRQSDALAKIADVFLIAPDVDIDVFDKQAQSLGDFAKRLTVLSGTDDRALFASSALAFNNRVGDTNIEVLRRRFGGEGITFIDTTRARASELFHHFKAGAPEIAAKIAARMRGDQGVGLALR